MKNPLIRRVPREIRDEWHKYAVIGIFLILVIGFVSGMYVANRSMLDSAENHKTEDKLEHGHFVLRDKPSEEFLRAIESGEQADVKTWFVDKAIEEALSEGLAQAEDAAKAQAAEYGMTISDADMKEILAEAEKQIRTEGRKKAEEAFEEGYADMVPESADPVPVKLYENYYKDREEDIDGDGEKDSGIRVFRMQDQINQADILKGKLPQSENEIAIDRMHADNNKIKVGDTIYINGKAFTVSGLIALVNYGCLYEKNSDTMFDALTFDVALVNDAAFDNIGGRTNYNYAWLYDGRTPSDEKEEKKLSDDFVKALGTQTIVYENELKDYLPAYANHSITFALDDMGKDKEMGGILLYILVAVLAFIFAITISSTIAKEASVIGTLRASGYTRGELLVHYMTMPVLVTLVSALIGNVLGYTLFKKVVVAMYYNSYSLPSYETYWSSEGFVKTTVVPLVLMFLINLFIIARKLRLSPLRFLRHDLKKSRRKKAIRLPRWKFFTRFKTRILMQNVPNYLVLFLGIAFVMTLLCMAVGMPATLKHYQDHFSEMMFVQNQLVLNDYKDEDKNVITTSTKGAERFSMESLNYRTPSLDEDISIYGVEEDSQYVKLPADLAEGEVYISTAFNGKYHFKEGDTITLDEKFEEKQHVFKVRGIFDYDAGIAVFMHNDEFNKEFGRDAASFNGYMSDSRIDDIDEKYIVTEITKEDLTKMARQLDHSMGAYMTYFQYLCVILSAVLIYLLTKIIISKNENSISMVKILGYENREIAKLYQMPTTVAVIISELLAMGVGYIVIYLFWITFMARLGGWFAFVMEPLDFVKMFVLVLIGYLIVMFIDFRRIRKIPMDQALKNVE